MTSRPRRRFWLKLAAGLLFAVVAYFGAYAMLVEALYSWSTVADWEERLAAGNKDIYDKSAPPEAIYPMPSWTGLDDDSLTTLFAPAHWIHRRLRPQVWEPSP